MHLQRNEKTKSFAVMAMLAFAIALAALPMAPTLVHAASCLPAGTTGLTASVVASSYQRITGTIDATGCDVGVYVGPGVTHVVIRGATISGANDHGIFVQDTSNIVIQDNTVTGNGVNPHSDTINENKALQLVGTFYSLVEGNVVTYNGADGGIGVADDGPIDPAAPNPGTLRASAFNVVKNNVVEFNLNGCGIVVASYNSGAGVFWNTVTGNTVIGVQTPAEIPEHGPAVGGIVVAADAPYTKVAWNFVENNYINGSLIPGVVVHSNAFGDAVTYTFVLFNKISYNGIETDTSVEPALPTGIMVVAENSPVQTPAPTISHTFIISNAVNNDYYGVWARFTSGTVVVGLTGNSVVPTDIA